MSAADVLIVPYQDGPYLVRGRVLLRDQDGREIEVARSPVALCRCGKSRIRPFCDGTHRLIGFHAPSPREARWSGEPASTEPIAKRSISAKTPVSRPPSSPSSDASISASGHSRHGPGVEAADARLLGIDQRLGRVRDRLTSLLADGSVITDEQAAIRSAEPLIAAACLVLREWRPDRTREQTARQDASDVQRSCSCLTRGALDALALGCPSGDARIEELIAQLTEVLVLLDPEAD